MSADSKESFLNVWASFSSHVGSFLSSTVNQSQHGRDCVCVTCAYRWDVIYVMIDRWYSIGTCLCVVWFSNCGVYSNGGRSIFLCIKWGKRIGASAKIWCINKLACTAAGPCMWDLLFFPHAIISRRMHNEIITDKHFILTNTDIPVSLPPPNRQNTTSNEILYNKLLNTFLLTHKLWIRASLIHVDRNPTVLKTLVG